MGLFELIAIIAIWTIARNLSRILRQGAPRMRQAATTLKEQLEKQMQGHTAQPKASGGEPIGGQTESPFTAVTLETPKQDWNQWAPANDDKDWHSWTELSGDMSQPSPEQKAPKKSPPPAVRQPKKQMPKQAPLPQLSGDALVQAVIFSEVLGPPKGRRAPIQRRQ